MTLKSGWYVVNAGLSCAFVRFGTVTDDVTTYDDPFDAEAAAARDRHNATFSRRSLFVCDFCGGPTPCLRTD